MPHVGFDRLLREEEVFADLSIHEAVRDELKDHDLAGGGILSELTSDLRREGNDGAVPARTATCRSRLEAAAVVAITVQDLLTLSSVHGRGIGALRAAL